jgi:hypothetical protein
VIVSQGLLLSLFPFFFMVLQKPAGDCCHCNDEGCRGSVHPQSEIHAGARIRD